MANRELFSTNLTPIARAKNNAGGKAYELGPKLALAQYASTGCLSSTYYAGAEAQLEQVLRLCEKLPAEFIAKTAIYCRSRGFMKDMPALLCAVLASKAPKLLEERVFHRVIDDAKMLRNFVQMMRSGVTGRRSLGSLPKRLVLRWLEARDDEALFRSSVGQSPSMADVIRMVHPRPKDEGREALYGYLLGRPHKAERLPGLVRQLEEFRYTPRVTRGIVPDVPFQMLTSLDLSPIEWAQVACKASWQTIRMNLNTFARHGVFEQPGVGGLLAKRLRDPNEVARARVFPYQLMMAHRMAGPEIPAYLREALEAAMELALQNVPELPGKVYVCPDVSGSMSSAVTGYRPGATSAVRCVDVAALVAAAVLRKNRGAEVLPFEHRVVPLQLRGGDRVMTNAQKLAGVGGGGTDCSAPLALLNQRSARGDLVIFVSDNESWADRHRGKATGMMFEWERFRKRNPGAKLVCIDIQPSRTTQAQEREDILNVGGFSDVVFEVIAAFAQARDGARRWVQLIEDTRL